MTDTSKMDRPATPRQCNAIRAIAFSQWGTVREAQAFLTDLFGVEDPESLTWEQAAKAIDELKRINRRTSRGR